MEINKKPKIFIHSWIPEGLKSKLEKHFSIDQHDASEVVLSGDNLLKRVQNVDGI